MEIDKKVEQILELLEPCLKRVRVNGNLRYLTSWGTKTDIGLKASLRRILEEDEEPEEEGSTGA